MLLLKILKTKKRLSDNQWFFELCSVALVMVMIPILVAMSMATSPQQRFVREFKIPSVMLKEESSVQHVISRRTKILTVEDREVDAKPMEMDIDKTLEVNRIPTRAKDSVVIVAPYDTTRIGRIIEATDRMSKRSILVLGVKKAPNDNVL